MKLKKIKDTSNGLYDYEDEVLQELKKEAEISQNEYENLRKMYPKEALKYDEYINTNPNERTEEAKRRFDENDLYNKILMAHAKAHMDAEDVKIIEQENHRCEKAKLDSLNCLLSNEKTDDFLVDLFYFTNVNLDYDRTVTSVLTNMSNTEDSFGFEFSTNLIANALLQKIHNFIHSLKSKNPCYILTDINECNDEKMQISKDILFRKNNVGSGA